MAASDHLNEQLFHGSSTRYGVVRPGELIVPLADLKKHKKGAISNHHVSLHGITDNEELLDAYDNYYPESYGVAHATPSFESAQNYAKWTASGGVRHATAAIPIVYEVHPSEDMEFDEYDDESFVSPKGFRVKNVAWTGDSK